MTIALDHRCQSGRHPHSELIHGGGNCKPPKAEAAE